MPRTTVDIDATILKDLKRLQRKEGKSLGRLVSDLLAQALYARTEPARPSPFHWQTANMRARFDLTDKDAVYAILDREQVSKAADEDE